MTDSEEVAGFIGGAIGSAESDRTRIDSTAVEVQATMADIEQTNSKIQELLDQAQYSKFTHNVQTILLAQQKAEEAQAQASAAQQTLLNAKGTMGPVIESLKEAHTYIQSMVLPTSTPSSTVSTFNRGPPPLTPSPPIPADYPLPQQIDRPSWSTMRHICEGDDDYRRELGGHMYGASLPEKTVFPQGWGYERIESAVTHIARYPETVERRNKWDWHATGTYRGIRVSAIILKDGSINAGWPRSG